MKHIRRQTTRGEESKRMTTNINNSKRKTIMDNQMT